MIYSTKAYHLVYCTRSGNYPTPVQFRRKVLIRKSPSIEQSRLCHEYQRYCMYTTALHIQQTNRSYFRPTLQYGFQKGKSTTSRLLSVLHNIHKCLEKRSQVDTIYLDFAKAFDKVSHEHLLAKLYYFGIRGNLLRWFGDYCSGRYQRVTVLGITPEPPPVLSGVPQGSILGPLLFLVYVNDLPKSTSNNTIVTMFADDTKCHRALQHPNDNKILQSDLDKITDWCNVWRMS